MRIHSIVVFVSVFALLLVGGNLVSVPQVESIQETNSQDVTSPLEILPEPIPPVAKAPELHATTNSDDATDEIEVPLAKETLVEDAAVYSVPFFSQFTDITAPAWKKVGCGITSLAMLVDFYQPGAVNVDDLLQKGIATGAYLDDAGWTYAGLINLSKDFGLTGETHDFGGSTTEEAYKNFKEDLADGPLMASVHYTFEPTNPIPHLVVITGLKDGFVYYNDPAEKTGGGSLAEKAFLSAWKKRYIEIRPLT